MPVRTAPRRDRGLLPLAAIAAAMLLAGGYFAARLDQAAGVDPVRQARFHNAVDASGH